MANSMRAARSPLHLRALSTKALSCMTSEELLNACGHKPKDFLRAVDRKMALKTFQLRFEDDCGPFFSFLFNVAEKLPSLAEDFLEHSIKCFYWLIKFAPMATKLVRSVKRAHMEKIAGDFVRVLHKVDSDGALEGRIWLDLVRWYIACRSGGFLRGLESDYPASLSIIEHLVNAGINVNAAAVTVDGPAPAVLELLRLEERSPEEWLRTLFMVINSQGTVHWDMTCGQPESVLDLARRCPPLKGEVHSAVAAVRTLQCLAAKTIGSNLVSSEPDALRQLSISDKMKRFVLLHC